ncbi:hypothetical protein PF005_g15076 [Phytophthora fragariae]|uniref:Arrestin-like N-terminal domain-containing protein n=1 Tax=Phytophthora fragariae TaxID=53985 RepID=A0A6A3YGQ5_9STRA|nr:hypothetical protein PF003_g11704 [Phytophthora fragariae]KAE8933642.1 hypothetical protein PF009_g16355 [Phytophthora fragariae]KAE8998759.1 hypothetical protein PF011_g14911 [Phytophthora fragariae]KAE9099033.1 hypothetical protein PF010_g15340 [Phytophthora fragariae]KAE9100619.1 hypothetical protein PF007_g15440 [Phytophthora fragariae]
MAYSHSVLRNARSGSVKWTLRVALDRDTYHAGDILQANVFLYVVEPVHCNGFTGFIRGEETITWTEKSTRRAVGAEVYSQKNEFLNDKMIVANPRMHGPGEYIFPVVYQLHSTLPATFQLNCHSVGVMNSVHVQLGYVFHVCLNANEGVVVEALQEIILQEAVLPTRPLMGLEVAPAPALVVQPDLVSQDNVPYLLASLDKPAFRSAETVRVRCRVNSRSGGDESFVAILRLYEDINITVGPSKRSECSRLVCKRRFQVAAGAAPFELALGLAAGSDGEPSLERTFCSSFVERRHHLAVECFPPGSTTDLAIVIL